MSLWKVMTLLSTGAHHTASSSLFAVAIASISLTIVPILMYGMMCDVIIVYLVVDTLFCQKLYSYNTQNNYKLQFQDDAKGMGFYFMLQVKEGFRFIAPPLVLQLYLVRKGSAVTAAPQIQNVTRITQGEQNPSVRMGDQSNRFFFLITIQAVNAYVNKLMAVKQLL